MRRLLAPRSLVLAFTLALAPALSAEEAITPETIAGLDKSLAEAKEASSEARKRLAVRRTIRDAQALIETNKSKPERFLALEFLFRAQQQLIKLDDDSKHRATLMEICRDLVKAPDEYAHLKFQADLLLSQAELAKQGANAEERAAALRPLVESYLETEQSARVLRVAMVMALELGDVKLVADLREMIARYHAADHEMISFQRDKLGGQVFGAPFAGTFKRSDGRIVRFPMDSFGRSTMVLFWSKEGEEGLSAVKGLAETTKKLKKELAGRMEVISFNLDKLPDAGESIVRQLGADWQCVHLPDGRESSIYKTYVRNDPMALRVSSTGQAAMIMAGVGRTRLKEDGTTDWERIFGSAFSRPWTRLNYCSQLCSISAGDFLVFDTEGTAMDPTRPPELKSITSGRAQPLKRTGDCVPEETLLTIQKCFIAPPTRYLLSYDKILAHYQKAADLCRKAITDHAEAPDLWIVRNRLMVALLGLWKVGGKIEHLESAFSEARIAMDAGYPAGCDVVTKLCLAREALRRSDTNTRTLIGQFVADAGGDNAPGPILAAASLLAMDVCDRIRFEQFRDRIIQQHSEEPMLWTFTAFLLDRHHKYWMFQVPFTAGWSYGRREGYFQTKGDPEEAHRMLRGELLNADGKPFRIPEDLTKDYTVIFFSNPGPWSSKRDDGLPPSPLRTIQSFFSFAEARPNADIEACFAVFGNKPHPGVLKDRKGKETKLAGTMLALPKGAESPLAHRLGMLSTDRSVNRVVLDKQGRILVTISGLGVLSSRSGNTLINVVARQDERKVLQMVEKGEAENAREFIYAIAPPYDANAVDDRGRKLRKQTYNLSHLRARARIHLALGDLEKALADAEQVCSRQLSTDGGMSLKTDQLVSDEAFRDELLAKVKNG